MKDISEFKDFWTSGGDSSGGVNRQDFPEKLNAQDSVKLPVWMRDKLNTQIENTELNQVSK
jgi:hypothetical protein